MSFLSFPLYYHGAGEQTFSDYKLFNVNNISAYVGNNGVLHQDQNPTTGDAGFEWPSGSGKYLIYASVPWLVAMVNGEVRMAGREYASTYNPGPMDAQTHRGAGRSDSTFRVYRIVRGDSTSWDYQHWPSALGAPVRSDGQPQVLGDQTLWCVYNCADSGDADPYGSKPLGVEVHQTVFGYNAIDQLFTNLMLVRYLIINKGRTRWTRCTSAFGAIRISVRRMTIDAVATLLSRSGIPTTPTIRMLFMVLIRPR